MKQAPHLKSLFSLIKFLQQKGCIVSASGHLELPFKATPKSLKTSLEDVMLDNAIKLERWLHKLKLNTHNGELGIDKTVTVAMKWRGTSIDVCRLVRAKTGGWQFRASSNYKATKRTKRTTPVRFSARNPRGATLH